MEKLSKLFTNKQLSFEVLEKLGFQKKNNRLLLECDIDVPSIEYFVSKIDFSYFASKPKISSKLKLFVKNIFSNLDVKQIPAMATVYDYYTTSGNDNVDNVNNVAVDIKKSKIMFFFVFLTI